MFCCGCDVLSDSYYNDCDVHGGSSDLAIGMLFEIAEKVSRDWSVLLPEGIAGGFCETTLVCGFVLGKCDLQNEKPTVFVYIFKSQRKQKSSSECHLFFVVKWV